MLEFPEAVALRRLIDLATLHLNFGEPETVAKRAEPVMAVLVMDCFETGISLAAKADGDKEVIGYIVCKSLDYMIQSINEDRKDIVVEKIRLAINVLLAVSKTKGRTNPEYQPAFLYENEAFIEKLKQTIDQDEGEQFLTDLLGLNCENCPDFMDCKGLTITHNGTCGIN